MRKERLTICHVVAQKNLSSLLMMHWKWQPFLTLASADYSYPCNLTAGVEVLWRFGLLDALEGWRVLTNNRTSEKFYGSPCDKIPSLSPWADGRARRGQCWSPLQLPFSFCYLMSCHSPINLAACVFFFVVCCLRGLFLFMLWREACLSFSAFPALGSAAGTGQQGGGEESKPGKERGWLHSLADRVPSEKEKRVCQPPAWTIRARRVPGFNLFYPLAACGGLSRPAATKGKSTELLPLK